MKIFTLILSFLFSSAVLAIEPKLFCHGDGIRSTLFYWDGNKSYEFVDIEFKSPAYLETYLACTNFLFKLKAADRNRKIVYAPLLNSFRKDFIRFADHEKNLFYNTCWEDLSCHVKFPYSLLVPKLFLNQTFNRQKTILQCKENQKALSPVAFRIPDHIPNLEFWNLPKHDLIKQFWKEANKEPHEKIILSAMTFSLDFLNALKRKYKDGATTVYILASFNLMSLDERITSTLAALPPNIVFVPIFQSSQEPYSHHQKGAIFFAKNKTTVVWNSSNFRKYETHKLFDIGMTLSDAQWGQLLANRWIKTAHASCSEMNAFNCNLQTRFSGSPDEMIFWKSMTEKSCKQLPALEKASPVEKNADVLILDLIAKAKKSIHVHTHVFGDSLVFKSLKAAQARGIDVKIIGGKPSRFKTDLPWVKFNSRKQEYHAKFILFDDTTFVWGTGNITKTSLSNQREDFFFGSNPEILVELKKYFEVAWD